jgi:hypothetical protein
MGPSSASIRMQTCFPVEKASGEMTSTYDPRRLSGVSVYREVERMSSPLATAFSSPRRTSQLGVANRDLGRHRFHCA